MTVSKGEEHFSHDFLAVYTAFKGELTQGDLSIGQQWFRVWQAAHDSMRGSIQVRASEERQSGRVDVADALLAATAPSSVLANAADAELAAWRERFPQYRYRPQDDCIELVQQGSGVVDTKGN